MNQQHKFNASINFLRAIAILGVVFYHIFPFYIKGGFLGVCLFFLISGYLLAKQGNTHWEDREFTFLGFYKKKIKRIYPALYLMVITIVAYFTLFHQELLLGVREEAASIFLGVNNWWQMAIYASYFNQVTEHSAFTHLWYMGVEIQLLLIWPFLFYFYKKVCEKKWGKLGIIFFAALAVLSALLMAVLYQPERVNRIYYGTDTRAFTFFIGVCLGLGENDWMQKVPKLFKGRDGRILSLVFLAVTVLLFILVPGEAGWLYYGGMAFISLFFGLMIFVMNCCRFNETVVAKIKWLQFIGTYSYWIYLWHYPLLFILMCLY